MTTADPMSPPQRLVVDASVATAYVFDEEASDEVRRAVRGWLEAETPLVVPSLFWLEVANAVGRGHGRPGRDVVEAIHRLDALSIETVELDRAMLLSAVDWMERFALTSYGAAYIALAAHLGARLVTRDRRQLRAAGALGRWVGPGQHQLAETQAQYGDEPPTSGATWPEYGEISAFLAKLRADARQELEAARS